MAIHELTDEQRQLRWQTLSRLFGIFALVVLFWFGYEHNDTLWITFNRARCQQTGRVNCRALMSLIAIARFRLRRRLWQRWDMTLLRRKRQRYQDAA